MVIVFVTVIVTVIVMVVAVYCCPPSGRGRRHSRHHHSRRRHSRRWQYRRGIYDLVYDLRLLPHEWAKPPIGAQILP